MISIAVPAAVALTVRGGAALTFQPTQDPPAEGGGHHHLGGGADDVDEDGGNDDVDNEDYLSRKSRLKLVESNY